MNDSREQPSDRTPDANGTLTALENILVEQAAEILRQDEANAGSGKQKAASEKGPTKAPLENRSDVDSRDRLNYRLNYAERRRFERGDAAERESAFAQTWRGRFWRWPGTRWLFDRQTRRMEFVILCGVLVALLGVAVSFGLSHREVGVATGPTTDVSAPIASIGEELLAGREASEKVIQQFFQARTLDEMRPLIRHPDVLDPIMNRWYESQPFRQEDTIIFDSATIKELDGSRYYLHFVYFENDIDPRPLAVEETAEGSRVDWETAVGYQSIPWEDYRRQRPAEKMYLRVKAQLDNYYNFEFGDPQEWSCFRLSHPDADSSIYGYVKKYSEMDNELRDVLAKEPSAVDFLILGLRFPETRESNHTVYIDEILQSKWVRVYNPGDTHFDIKPH